MSWDEPYVTVDEDDEVPVYQPDPDSLTVGVGGRWYAERYMVDECRRVFPGSVLTGASERFDRFYVLSDVGPLLVDVLVGDREMRELQRERKHVPFKEWWCAKHDRRYLVLSEEEAADPQRVRGLLAGEQSAPKVSRTSAQRSQRRRGGVQRPKAAA